MYLRQQAASLRGVSFSFGSQLSVYPFLYGDCVRYSFISTNNQQITTHVGLVRSGNNKILIPEVELIKPHKTFSVRVIGYLLCIVYCFQNKIPKNNSVSFIFKSSMDTTIYKNIKIRHFRPNEANKTSCFMCCSLDKLKMWEYSSIVCSSNLRYHIKQGGGN